MRWASDEQLTLKWIAKVGNRTFLHVSTSHATVGQTATNQTSAIRKWWVLSGLLSLGLCAKLLQFSLSSCEGVGLVCLQVWSAQAARQTAPAGPQLQSLQGQDNKTVFFFCFFKSFSYTFSALFDFQWPTMMESSTPSWPKWRSLDGRNTTSCNWFESHPRFNQSGGPLGGASAFQLLMQWRTGLREFVLSDN